MFELFKSKGLFLTGMLFSVLSQTALATWENPHLIIAYQGFMGKKYDVCADEAYLASQSAEDGKSSIQLLLAVCQFRLGLKTEAAYNLNQSDIDELSSIDKLAHQQLQVKLKNELADLDRLYFTFLPYLGQSWFTSPAVKDRSLFYGGFGNIQYQSWNVFFNLESIDMSFRETISQYSQSQFNFGFSKTLNQDWSFKLLTTGITSSLITYTSGRIYGVGVSYNVYPLTAIGLDYYHSNYPTSSLTGLSVNQGNLYIDQKFFSQPDLLLSLKGVFQTVVPSAVVTTDVASGFVMASAYSRYAAELKFIFDIVQLNLTGWMGREAFGVRNNGVIVFNTFEDHKKGWSAGLGVNVSNSLLIRGVFSEEFYTVNGPEIGSITYYGGLAMNF